ncbi:hypothetical protein SAY86_023976 [Trapa natans]|uniref:RING-type E3 ubiquitin transferase n=1 Tax=Trapa natans TaxID=22666 RepID=A0AAN7LVD1_TRANT|nr:hypothetical protein SAY86_023976 [Trapa natans]
MSFHVFEILAGILPGRIPELPSSSASWEVEVMDEDEDEDEDEDDGLILFTILYHDYTTMPVINGPTQETADWHNYCQLITQDFIKRTASKHFHRSQLMGSPTSAEVKSALTSLAATLVPEVWVEETVEHLVHLASLLGTRLSNLCEQPLTTALPRVVDVTISTITVVKPTEASHPLLVDYFQQLEADARGIANAKVYQQANLSASSIKPTNQIDVDDCCPICTEEYSSTAVNDKDCGTGGEVQDIVIMPCSHKYHSRCIFKWLRIKNVCPLCRFRLNDDYEVFVIRPIEIFDLTL